MPRALTIRSDVVLAMTDPPIEGIAGALVARLSGRPFVYNLRDMYPDMAVGGDIVRPESWVERWETLHRRALRRAARVIVLGEDMRERIIAKGVDPARITICRDAVPFPETLPAPDHPVVREIRGEFRFVLVHAGNLGFYGAWETLIQAARMLEPDGVGLVFVGEGAMKGKIEAMAAGLPERALPAVSSRGRSALCDGRRRFARGHREARARGRRRAEQGVHHSGGGPPAVGRRHGQNRSGALCRAGWLRRCSRS